MKVRDTSRGRMYAISSETGCTALNGAMAMDIPAGGQSVILALDKKIVIDGDDAAKFVEVRWGTNTAVGSRPVPAWLSDVLAGLISILGDDNFDINYIPSENKLVVHTDRVDDAQFAAVTAMLGRFVPASVEVVQYNHHIEVSWRDINRYASCKSLAEMNAVAQNYGFESYKDDLTSDGWWIYPLDSIEGANFSGFFGNYQASQASTKIRHAYLYLPKVNSNFIGASLVSNCKNLEYVYLYAPGLWTNCQELAKGCTKLTFFEAYVPNIYRINDWCAGCTSLSHFRFLAPLKEGGLAGGGYAARIWDGCVLDVASVQNIAENLPTMPTLTTTTIGIDEAFQNDEAMLEALAVLEGKNWNIEKQWNPAPTTTTASTYSFGRRLIYAKVTEIDGERIMSWGHEVTDPTGYEQFRSLESAYEYFGLEMPEVETEE